MDIGDWSKLLGWVALRVEAGDWGPSPGEAAKLLGCARATVDDLVRIGALERLECSVRGHRVVVISQRSIDDALVSYQETGCWSGVVRPRGKWD